MKFFARVMFLMLIVTAFIACPNPSGDDTDDPVVAVTGVSFNTTEIEVVRGATAQLGWTVSPTDATNENVSFLSGDQSIATVDEEGLVTGVAIGQTTITVTTEDGSHTDTIEVDVVYSTPTGVSFSTDAVTVGQTKTKQLEWTVLPANTDQSAVSFVSDDENIVTVDADGIITGSTDTIGTATVTITTDDGGFTDTIEVTVETYTAVTSITLEQEGSTNDFTCQENDIKTIEVSIAPDNPTESGFSISLDDTSLGEITREDQNGRDFDVWCKSEGTLTVTVKSDDNESIEDTITITINADTTRPEIEDFRALDANTLYLVFSERMNTTDVQTIGNYTLTKNSSSEAIDSITLISADDEPRTQISMALGEALADGDELGITVATSVSDLAGNGISDSDNDSDGQADNYRESTYYPGPSNGVDATKIEESTGNLSLAAGAVTIEATVGGDAGWYNYMVFAVPAGEALSQTSIVGVCFIDDSDGSSAGSNFKEGFDPSAADKTFENGDYDLYVSATYDLNANGGDGDGSEDEPMTFNIADKVTYTVTTGL